MIDPPGKQFVLVSAVEGIAVFDIDSMTITQRLEGEFGDADFSPDGKTIVLTNWDEGQAHIGPPSSPGER
jgi:WD40 repeat protein